MKFTDFRLWLAKQAQILTLVIGSCLVSLWTVLRHITNGVNFDVVGQIGVVQQWTNGLHQAVLIGPTNYVLKFPLYYVVNQIHFLTAMDRVLLLALLCNVLTFGFIFAIFDKTLTLYQIRERRWLYLAMGWLATIAGKTFWVDYANSRNLETVGGLLVLYLILDFWKRGRPRTLALLALAAALTFFADPLQMYIIVGGLLASFGGALAIKFTKQRQFQLWSRSAKITVAVGGAVIISKVISYATQHLLQISYLQAPRTNFNGQLSTVIQVAQNLGRNTLKIFDADIFKHPYSLNSLRALLNSVILVVVTALIIRLVARRRARASAYAGLTLIAVNYALYIASGQVLQWETSRYLVMIPLLTIGILVIHSDRLPKRHAKSLQLLWLTGLVASSVLLVGALVISWPQRHSKDAVIYNTISYLHQQHFPYALANREIGITATYFSQGSAQVLPMGCSADHRLQLTNLFYDSAGFASLQSYQGQVPIILENQGITYGKFYCSQNDIIAQFGQPDSIQKVAGLGSVLVYQADQLKQPEITGRPAVAKTATAPEILTNLLPLQGCDNGTTDVFVAHPDDDILFMNPDLEQQLMQQCLRTIYLTAADDGRSAAYWQGRERGIEAAYAFMVGAPDSWQDVPTIINGHRVLERVLEGRPSLALVFMRLPDGNVTGEGFAATGHQSLSRLAKHKIKKINAVDATATYTNGSLIQTLTAIMKVDQPTIIYSQLLSGQNSKNDHSDHRAVGHITSAARIAAASKAQVSLYFGYPVNGLSPNLDAEVSLRKRAIFSAYADADTEICHFKNNCSIEDTYGRYFSRSYKTEIQQAEPTQLGPNQPRY